jgi:tRNA-Thr(GGU) m(6)t(6)A37 methyltransferase TsaA
MKTEFKSIGVIRTAFKTKKDIPQQKNISPGGYKDDRGTLEIFEEYEEGLKDIDGFSHLILIFMFHESETGKLIVHPPHDHKPRGVFSTRSPHRPNPLGMTIVRLLGREKNLLFVSGVDMLDETPILDIKPYTIRDLKTDIKLGWLEPYSK